MEQQEVIDIINDILINDLEVDINDIKEESSLKTDLALDSLSLVDLIALTERRLGVKLEIEHINKINTIGDLYLCVSTYKD